MTRMEPIALALLEEGRVLEDLDNTLQTVAGDLARYAETWGADAEKATASVSLKITLKKEDIDRAFSIKTELASKCPERPALTSMAIAEQDDDGLLTLWVPRSGSHGDDARQRKLCTDDGRVIDQETGEVADG